MEKKKHVKTVYKQIRKINKRYTNITTKLKKKQLIKTNQL